MTLHVIRARNVNDAWAQAVEFVEALGVPVETRGGRVRQLPGPLVIHTLCPRERILLSPTRRANPFFHLAESLWMLGGGRRIAPLREFLPRVDDFSDDGATWHGAYGWRWRGAFGTDQLDDAVRELRANPATRRVVLQMWDTRYERTQALRYEAPKDLPCNLTVTVQRGTDGRLDLVVLQRSGDLVWGTLGANAVQFSFLLEYLAARAEFQPGTLTQVVANAHVYEAVWRYRSATEYATLPDAYTAHGVRPTPLALNPDALDVDLVAFQQWLLDGAERLFHNPFFLEVAQPMVRCWRARVAGAAAAVAIASRIEADDWRLAAYGWLSARFGVQIPFTPRAPAAPPGEVRDPAPPSPEIP